MFITILEGNVKEQNWTQLEKDFETEIRHAPDGLIESFLIHCLEVKGLWRIISIWKDEETYRLYKDQDVTGICERLFCDAGTSPRRSHHQIHQRYTRV